MPLLTTFYDDDNHGITVSFIALWLCLCIASGGYCGVNGLCELFFKEMLVFPKRFVLFEILTRVDKTASRV